jgi:hypothetical protein
MSSAADDVEEPIISAALADAIASWRRVFGGRQSNVDPRRLLRSAADELFRALRIDKTIHPDLANATHQAAVDALHEMATAAGIAPDTAQAILADAAKAPHAETKSETTTPPGTTSRFAPIWLSDIIVEDDPPYLVDGVLPLGPSLGLTFGLPGSLKTFFLMHLLLHVAAGLPCSTSPARVSAA